MKSKTSGNVLFLILIAVALFAALSYAVTSSTRSGGGDTSKEKTKMGAAQILQFVSAIDVAVLRMRQNMPIENISFGYPRPNIDGSVPNLTTYGNPGCITDECMVFKPLGGGVSPIIFSSISKPLSTNVPSDPAPGTYKLFVISVPNAGTSLKDIVLEIGLINGDVCNEINASQGITDSLTASGGNQAASDPANWNSGSRVINIASPEQITGITTFANSVLNENTCSVFHVVFAR